VLETEEKPAGWLAAKRYGNHAIKTGSGLLSVQDRELAFWQASRL
jgi:hypothetical protein